MAAGILATVNDIALGIDTDFHLHPANAADLRNVPNFAECLVVTFGCRLHFQFLEAVLPTVVTRVPFCNSFGALE